jgi:zinc/manganese transport system ATP-binding protein
MTSREKIIRLEHIYTAYEGADRPTLADISISIGKGEFVIIGGPNGAGKTTLLETINGMLTITHGNAVVCGLDVQQNGAEVRRNVGYLLQNFSFDPLTPFTVEEVVMMGRFGKMGFFRRPGLEDNGAVFNVLHLLEIEDLASRPIGQLSGGQQQKVLLAQNLVRDPQVLLLDEPFSNLDMFARESINRLLAKLVSSGISVVIVSHAFDDLPDCLVRVVVIHDGRISLDRECLPIEVGPIIRNSRSEPHNA